MSVWQQKHMSFSDQIIIKLKCIIKQVYLAIHLISYLKYGYSLSYNVQVSS